MKREIINIDRDKCTGCGLCVPNCYEGALQIIDGKAVLISELMCDGLGACVGHCPEDAITIEEREAEPYNEIAVLRTIVQQGKNTLIAHLSHLKEHKQEGYLREGVQYLKQNEANLKFSLDEVLEKVHNSGAKYVNKEPVAIKQSAMPHGQGCPGSLSRSLRIKEETLVEDMPAQTSQLANWPIQLHLVNPAASYFNGSDVLLAADCVSYALADFHSKYLKGKTLMIACPKLDSNKEIYVSKLINLINDSEIKSITIMKMEVPCCNGILQMAQLALSQANRSVPLKSLTVGINGELLN
jgi:NAD-dependent dihydropyrimidine dehydrogenase PreA subunit